MRTGTQRPNRKHTWNALPITGCCFREYALSFKQFVRNVLSFFKYFNRLAQSTMTRLFAVYIFYQNKTLYYHQQNCLFPSASRLVLQTCIVLIGYMCVCYVLGEGEGVGFPCCALSALGQMDLSKLFRSRSDCSVVCLIRVYAVYFHTTHSTFGYTGIIFQYCISSDMPLFHSDH